MILCTKCGNSIVYEFRYGGEVCAHAGCDCGENFVFRRFSLYPGFTYGVDDLVTHEEDKPNDINVT